MCMQMKPASEVALSPSILHGGMAFKVLPSVVHRFKAAALEALAAHQFGIFIQAELTNIEASYINRCIG